MWLSRLSRMNIKAAILIPVMITLVVGVSVVAALIGIQSARTATGLTDQLMEQTAERYIALLEAEADTARGIAGSLEPVMRRMRGQEDGRTETIAIMKEMLREHNGIVAIWTVWEPNRFDGQDKIWSGRPNHDATGRFVPYVYKTESGILTEALTNYTDPLAGQYYLGAKNSGELFVTDPYEYRSGSGAIMVYSIAVPVREGGEVVGVVGVDVDLTVLSQMVDETHILEDGYAFVINHNGLLVAHSNPEFLLTRYTNYWVGENQDAIEQVMREGISFRTATRSEVLEKQVILNVNPVRMEGSGGYWAVCSVVPIATVQRSARQILLLIVVAGILLTAGIAFALHTSLNRNLRELTEVTQTAVYLSKGEFGLVSTEAVEDQDTKNEVVLLKKAFFEMVEDLRRQVQVVQTIAKGDLSVEVQPRSGRDLLNVALQEMLQANNRVFHEVRDSAGTVRVSAGQISHGAHTLAQATLAQSTTVNQFYSSVREIEVQVEDNRANAARVAALSADAGAMVDRSVAQIEAMTDAVDQIRKSNLDIADIIRVINDIAFETGILAINASIEAARAQSAGGGFGAVAAQVRDLARKSAKAAGETGSLVEESTQRARSGVRIARETTELLKEVQEKFVETNLEVGHVPEIVDLQLQAIHEINQAIHQVARMADQTSASAQESAATSEELNSQAEVLHKLIGEFRLNEGQGVQGLQPEEQPAV